MRCLLCKSAMENKCTNYIADLGNRIIVIHNVSVRIQKLINQVKDIISGIAELSYSEVS